MIAPATFQLQATASDLDGTVTQVQFFRDKTAIGLVTNAPYSIPIKNLPAGNYTFEAAATDNLGGTRNWDTLLVLPRRHKRVAGARHRFVRKLFADQQLKLLPSVTSAP